MILRLVRGLPSLIVLAAVSACVAYAPVAVVPAPQTSMPQRFDRSWDAALGALSDQGLAITQQDRGAGVIRGARGGITVTATLQTLADGSIRVGFTSPGNGSADADLIRGVTDSYQRRMGR